MEILRHECIRAFAGSGKTHALVNRYIRLLALGVRAPSINAMTFTRKAAGEFLQKIFLRLTGAAGEAGLARDLSRDIGQEDLGPADYQRILVQLVADLGELQLATIDSFFARLISAFPHELGLARPHRIMDKFEHSVARITAMERLLRSGDEDREQRVLQIYKNLTWGAEEKNVYRIFEEKLKDHQALFLEGGNPERWGTPGAIYSKTPWWHNSIKDPDDILLAFRRELVGCEFDKRMTTAMNKLLADFESYNPATGLDVTALLSQLLEQREALKSGSAVVIYYRKEWEIPDAMGKAIYQFLQYWMSREIARRMVITRSLGDFVGAYDSEYERSVREFGSLVFADITMLLIPRHCTGKAAYTGADKVYRRDSQTDHWLIDEFQDTSRIQWKVLSLFIDEILQDAWGQRSFFYVGDVKQSIYAWRGGDPRLFNEIINHYNSEGTRIHSIPLEHSWRSSPPVLDCVNQMFGTAFPAALVGGEFNRRWEEHWLVHRPSPKTRDMPGHAAWGLVETKEELEPACVELIRKVDPLSKGLSCAILVRKNDEVQAFTQILREACIPASMEGVVKITRDNVVGRWVLAFLHSLARPGETFPRAYLEAAGSGLADDEYARLAGLIRTVITHDGYAEGVRRLLALLQEQLEFNEFLNHRAEQILEAATRFEDTGMSGLERFIAYLDESEISEASLGSQIQVMTVHKAKGLDFDMVIVAGFGTQSVLRSGQKSLHVERDNEGDIKWILDLPTKQVHENDPVLADARRIHDEEMFFESLCLLYVAMTRGRHALYCLSDRPTGNRNSTTWHDLFQCRFSDGSNPRGSNRIEWQAEWGDSAWIDRVKRHAAQVPEEVALDAIRGPMPQTRPALTRMASPSEEAHAELGPVTTLRSNAGREFGTRMHDYLSLVEWVNPSGLEKTVLGADEDLQARARALFQSSLGKEVFTRPESPHQLWREKPYVLRSGNKVAHGIIDRAIVYLDSSGAAETMIIYDFKTDALDPSREAAVQLMEKYHIQVARYHEAAMALTGLAPEAIRTVLIPV